MNKLPSTLTKNQAIAFAVEAFNNFLNSGNTSYFDILIIETFYIGAMETHDKRLVVKFSKKLKENHQEKMKINIEKLDM